jgi:hypothetical protein
VSRDNRITIKNIKEINSVEENKTGTILQNYIPQGYTFLTLIKTGKERTLMLIKSKTPPQKFPHLS